MARSYMSDFMGGVDPTGTSTFQYGLEDARQGQHSGMRKAVGTAGGVVGGAAVLPGGIGGLVGGIKGFALGKGGFKGRMMSAGRHALEGAKNPYTSLYRGVRARGALKAHQAGKTLSSGQAGHLDKFVRGAVPQGVIPAGNLNPKMIQGAMNKMSPEQLGSAQRHLTGELAAGAGALGLSGVVSGGSAAMQYDKGGLTGQKMNRAMGRPVKQAGYNAALTKLSLF